MTDIIINEANNEEYSKILELVNVLYQNNQQTNQALLELKISLEALSEDFKEFQRTILTDLNDLKLEIGDVSYGQSTK